MTQPKERRRGKEAPQRKRARKPHNARMQLHNETLSDIVEAVGAQPRRLRTQDGEAMMSRKERCYRLTIERALRGQVRDLAHLLRLMAKYPDISVERGEIHCFISRVLMNV